MNTSKTTLANTLGLGCMIGSAAALYLKSSDASVEALPVNVIQATSSSKQAASAEVTQANSTETFDTRVAAAYAYQSQRRQDWEIERLFENMTAEEAPELLALILATPDYSKPGGLLGPFFGRWAELDGAAALAASQPLEGRFGKDAVKYLFPAWARSDVHAAWAASLAALGEPRPRFSGWLGDVIEEMAKQDPDVIIDYINTNPSQKNIEYLTFASIRTAAKANSFSQLLTKAQALSDEGLRAQWALSIYRDWAAKDADGALEEIGKITDVSEASKAMDGFLTGWAQSDREAALEHLFANKADASVQNVMGSMLSTAAQAGTPDENARLIERLHQAGLLDQFAKEVGNQLVNAQPENALAMASLLDDAKDAAAIQQRAISKLAETDFEAAHNAYSQIESGARKVEVLTEIVFPLMRQPHSGLKLVRMFDSTPPSKERTQLVERVLTSASRMGPLVGKDFLEALDTIAKSEPELSPRAQAARAKLFPPQD